MRALVVIGAALTTAAAGLAGSASSDGSERPGVFTRHVQARLSGGEVPSVHCPRGGLATGGTSGGWPQRLPSRSSADARSSWAFRNIESPVVVACLYARRPARLFLETKHEEIDSASPVTTVSCPDGYLPLGAGLEFRALLLNGHLTPPPLPPRLIASRARGRTWTFEMEHRYSGTYQVRCVRLAGTRFGLRTKHVVRNVDVGSTKYVAIRCGRGWAPLYAGWEGSGVISARVGREEAKYVVVESTVVLDVLCLRRRID